MQRIPIYANGHTSPSFATLPVKRTEECLADVGHAMEFSTLNSVLCGTQSCKGVTHLAEGRHDEAVDWVKLGAHASQ